MKIGIIGAENSHTAAIAKTLNVEKLVEGFSVDYVWGETAEFAKKAADAGQIPNIVEHPEKMLRKIDALIVDHRHAKYHLPAALPFIETGIPIFIDKPFCCSTAEGKEFLKIARKYKTPVTCFSMFPVQKSFGQFAEKLKDAGTVLAGTTSYVCDINSEYGGIFFYGIHQIETALKAFGYDVIAAFVSINGNGSAGQLIYSNGKIVTLNFIKKGLTAFHISAIGSNGVAHQELVMDEKIYLSGIKTFTAMFKTRQEPEKHEDILMVVAVLEALDKSIKSGKIERVKI